MRPEAGAHLATAILEVVEEGDAVPHLYQSDTHMRPDVAGTSRDKNHYESLTDSLGRCRPIVSVHGEYCGLEERAVTRVVRK